MRGDLRKGVLSQLFFPCLFLKWKGVLSQFFVFLVVYVVVVFVFPDQEKEELVVLAAEKARAAEAVSMTTTLAAERALANTQVEGDVTQVQARISEVQTELAGALTLYNDAKASLGKERDRKNALEKELGAAIVKAQGEGAGLEQKIHRLRDE